MRIVVLGPTGRPVWRLAERQPALHAFERQGWNPITWTDGRPVDARLAGTWIRAEGTTWSRIPAPDAEGVARVTLAAAGPPLKVRVTEADGTPVAFVPVLHALSPSSRAVRTDTSGVATVDDAPRGVLRVRVGGAERAGPVLRVVIGRDREASVVLDPPWRVEGKTLATAPSVLGATVEGRASEGRSGLVVRASIAGSFAWAGRISEFLSLSSEGNARSAYSELDPPSPRDTLRTRTELREVPGGAALHVEVRGDVEVTAEPAVLEIAREVFGTERVLLQPRGPSLTVERGRNWPPWPGEAWHRSFDGLDPAVPVRVRVRGGVVPEDHVVTLAGLGGKPLVISPVAAPAEAGTPPPAPADPRATAVVVGKVVDVKGKPLQGVTVGGGGARAVSGADGTFRLEGLLPSTSLEVVFGWLDGADPGDAKPSEYAPWMAATLPSLTEPATLVLPFAAGATLRLVDGLDDAPLSWAHLVVADADGRMRFDAPVATREGRVTLPDLVPGVATTLWVLAPGYRRSVPLPLRGGAVVDVGDVQVSHGARISGTVKDRKGTPIEGATVALLDDGRPATGAAEAVRRAELDLRRTTTGADGGFVLEGLDDTRPTPLAVWAPGFAPQARRVSWAKPGTAETSVTLVRGAQFRLRITDPAGQPVSGAVVDVESARQGVRWLELVRTAVLGGAIGSTEDVVRASEMLLQEDLEKPGSYRVGPVEPGPCIVRVRRPGYAPLDQPFTVPEAGADLGPAIPLSDLEWPMEMKPLPPGAR
jgi:hypothetical protein